MMTLKPIDEHTNTHTLTVVALVHSIQSQLRCIMNIYKYINIKSNHIMHIVHAKTIGYIIMKQNL